jgi:hypothetical protein
MICPVEIASDVSGTARSFSTKRWQKKGGSAINELSPVKPRRSV